MTGISVVSADDRPTREEQIQQLCGHVDVHGNVKVRFLAQLYDESKQQYAGLRDAQWTVTIPKAALTPDMVEGILTAMTWTLRRIGEQGSDAVVRVLESFEDPT